MIEHDLFTVAFPKLTDEQIRQIGLGIDAAPKRYRDGERLFAVGDRDINFFIVKSGGIEIIDTSGDEPRSIATHTKGESSLGTSRR